MLLMHIVVQYWYIFSSYQGKQQVQVKLSPEQGIEGEQLELTCVTSCPVNGRLATFTWYKDSSLLLGQNQHQHFVLDPVRVENMGKYSCGLSGHEEIHSKPVQLLVQCKSL